MAGSSMKRRRQLSFQNTLTIVVVIVIVEMRSRMKAAGACCNGSSYRALALRI